MCDRLGCRLRKTRHKRKTRQSILELIDHGTLRLTVACGSMTWAAGQHACVLPETAYTHARFLSFPGVQSSPHESHPFSFANAPNEDKVALFILKVHAGVTKRLHDSLGCATTGLVLVQLEGPYGSAVDMSRASSVILIAGMGRSLLAVWLIVLRRYWHHVLPLASFGLGKDAPGSIESAPERTTPVACPPGS